MRETSHMHTKRMAVAVLLLNGFLAGSIIARGAMAGETNSQQSGEAFSSSARASVSATIANRPGFTCERLSRAVTVRISPIPPLDGHLDSVAFPQSNCSYLARALSLALEVRSDGAVPAESSDDLLVVPVGTNNTTNSDYVAPSGHKHIIEIIYNFE